MLGRVFGPMREEVTAGKRQFPRSLLFTIKCYNGPDQKYVAVVRGVGIYYKVEAINPKELDLPSSSVLSGRGMD